jgi:hypothetical protein
MKISCFTMMKNESAILNPFLDQISTFFDHAIILDHCSMDASVDLVRTRKDCNIEIFKLKASGYPQSEVASYFGHYAFERVRPDFIFFLDCDEFLPFNDRDELIGFLADKTEYDCVRFHWRNISPYVFDGSDIFSGGKFKVSKTMSSIPKIIVSHTLHKRDPGWLIEQGYHGAIGTSGEPLRIFDVIDRGLFHVPIQTRTQFLFKLASGSQLLKVDKNLLQNGQGYHWVDLAQHVLRRGVTDEELCAIALGYPDKLANVDENTQEVKFGFPYIRSKYNETPPYIAAQIQGIMRIMNADAKRAKGGFAVTDLNGQIIITDEARPKRDADEITLRSKKLPIEFDGFGEYYSALIEPLFNLPTKLPTTAWAGHIPFLFVLFRLLKPENYVELGVHNGASLIAACSAAATYGLRTVVSGVDNWQGDAHAGFYEGEIIYQDLKRYLDSVFPNARLERCFFTQALSRFARESIDILHIDGLHTFDAVKEDFSAWFDMVSPTGIVLLHDISVYEQGFGVNRFWSDLKDKFTTLEFHHSAGLGIVILDPTDARLAPLVELSKHPARWQFYQNLVADIANTLKERMTNYTTAVAAIEPASTEPMPLPPQQKVKGLTKLKREISRVFRRR